MNASLKTSIEEKIRKSGLKVTPLRNDVIQIFNTEKRALNSHFIIEKLNSKYDRVSVFRTLNTFLEHGLLHSIPTSKDHVFFALCGSKCAVQGHHDEHVHFICDVCGETTCLNSPPELIIDTPDGYTVNLVSIQAKGICKKCSSKNTHKSDY